MYIGGLQMDGFCLVVELARGELAKIPDQAIHGQGEGGDWWVVTPIGWQLASLHKLAIFSGMARVTTPCSSYIDSQI